MHLTRIFWGWIKLTNCIYRAQLAVSKRIFQPWYQIDWLWKITDGPDHIEKFTQIHTKIFDKVRQILGFFDIHANILTKQMLLSLLKVV